MSDFHQLRVEGAGSLEASNKELVKKKLLWAREKSWAVFNEIKKSFVEGMTEKEGFELARKTFKSHGVEKHWHKPYVRFGPGTVLTFHDGLQPDYKLQQNDPVYIDLGPAWYDEETKSFYEGDVGDSFVFGDCAKAEKICEAAREVFYEMESLWKE